MWRVERSAVVITYNKHYSQAQRNRTHRWTDHDKTVQYSTTQTLQCNTTQYSTKKHSKAQYSVKDFRQQPPMISTFRLHPVRLQDPVQLHPDLRRVRGGGRGVQVVSVVPDASAEQARLLRAEAGEILILVR